MSQTCKTDPFLLEVLRYAFDTIAEEITLTIVRTAYIQIVRDSLDFSTALCDAQGRTLAQGVCTPMHLGAFHDALRNMLDQIGDDIHPDDVFIMNDPYAALGQHLRIEISESIFPIFRFWTFVSVNVRNTHQQKSIYQNWREKWQSF